MVWSDGFRARAWDALDAPVDVVVVGGGITGAGIFGLAAARGLRVALFEAKDFAWGTSSRSSKLVHGGLRYLRQGRVGLTRESVREREWLLSEGAGLVHPLGFVVTHFEADPVPSALVGLGLAAYDLMAWRWAHERWSHAELMERIPALRGAPVKGAHAFSDAQTDDARLTLRVLRQGVRHGGIALNHTPVIDLLRRSSGAVEGVRVRDGEVEREVRARVVINATGAWADGLRARVGRTARMRAIRGSHLVFPLDRLPLERAVALLHPATRRGVFALPWEGVALVGTTDVDHTGGLEDEPRMSEREAGFLIEAVVHAFPGLELSLDDALGSFSGVRPALDTGASDPSKETREHAVWREHNLLTVAGGKLTTFRAMAVQALDAVADLLPARGEARPLLDATPAFSPLPPEVALRLCTRHGLDAAAVAAEAEEGELEAVPGTPVLWAELRWAAGHEAVRHLDDLLLRRARIGLLLPEGGRAVLPRVRAIVQPVLGWDDVRWEEEQARYLEVWRRSYGPVWKSS